MWLRSGHGQGIALNLALGQIDYEDAERCWRKVQSISFDQAQSSRPDVILLWLGDARGLSTTGSSCRPFPR